MKRLSHLVFVLLLGYCNIYNPSLAQQVVNKKDLKEAASLVKKGEKYLKLEEYKEAKTCFIKATRLDPNNALAQYRVGEIILPTSTKKKALPFLKRARDLDDKIHPDLYFMLGRAYHFNLEFDEAVKCFTKFKQFIKPGDEKAEFVNRLIDQCQTAKELVDDPMDIRIEPVGPPINTDYKEYSSVISADESVMMFTSRRPGSTGEKTDEEGQFMEDIYISYNINGQWTEPKNMGKPINKDDHDACISVSPDGQTLYIYKSGKTEIEGDIFESKLKGIEWSKPKKMDEPVDSKLWEGSCCLSPDGSKFYFVSTREGGFGGKDIYMAEKDKKGRWANVQNIGSNINTQFDEDAIFLHPDGRTMYFSSMGHKTMGGFDVFKSIWNDDGNYWSTPVNMGYPVNTPDDDVFFVLSASGEHGYYASDKDGNLDIYIIRFPKPFRPPLPVSTVTAPQLAYIDGIPYEVEPKRETGAKAYNPLTVLKGVISDAESKIPLGCTIQLIDNEKNEVISELYSNDASGKYIVTLPSGKNYGIAIQKDGYLFHSENFDIPLSADYQEIIKDVQLKKMEVGKKIILKNIFFDTAKWTLRPESKSEIERLVALLNENKKLKIEISGHTDNVGPTDPKQNEIYNQKLSENRAKTVVEELIKNAISADRLTYAGYGFSRPIESNDTRAGRQMNRRTEFEVMSNQ